MQLYGMWWHSNIPVHAMKITAEKTCNLKDCGNHSEDSIDHTVLSFYVYVAQWHPEL